LTGSREATLMLCALLLLGCKVKVGASDGDSEGDFPCQLSEQCPLSESPCLSSMCFEGQCVFVPAPDGVLPEQDQRAGDCKHLYCDGEGDVFVQPASFDVPTDDGNPCTEEVCDVDEPRHVPKVAGTRCGADGICNGAETCGVCLPKAIRCDGQATTTCGAEGQWSKPEGCHVATPRCSAGKCLGFSEVALGAAHACARFDDGAVLCWGANHRGQLGDAGGAATPVAWWGSMREVAAGPKHACAIGQNGAVHCWGANDHGQLGNGSYNSSAQPVATGVTDARAIVVGRSHSCALTTAGDVFCWGANDHGQISGGTPNNDGGAFADPARGAGRHEPQRIAGVSAEALLLADDFSCVRRGNATTCWGMANYDLPEPLEPLEGETATPAQQEFLATRKKRSSARPRKVAGLGRVTQVAAGSLHSCAVINDGTVRCWGAGFMKQHGGKTTTDAYAPVTVEGANDISSIVVGDSFSCALSKTRDVVCWGANDAGQLGTRTQARYDGAGEVAGLGRATQLFAGGSFACALAERQLLCWGDNRQGQLGHPSPPISPTPLPMAW